MPARGRWAAAAVLAVACVLWLVLFAPRLLVPPAADASLRDVSDPAKRHELRDSRLKLQNDVRTTLLQGVGGLAVLIGAFFTYRQVQTSRHQLEVARQGQVTERFTRAIDQLGHENLDVRLGGIYALQRIAIDSPEDCTTIAEVLTAFVRGHAPWPPTLPGQYVEDAPIEDVPPLQVRAQDVQAALTVLSRRIPPQQFMDLAATDLRWAELSAANLEWANLSMCHLESSNLNRARLQEANLIGANLRGSTLLDAKLSNASLKGANLAGALLLSADLQDANLAYARLQGAELVGTNLKGANLLYTQLQGASLSGVELQGARCNAETVWPDGFDWEAAGVFSEETSHSSVRGN
jgi:Pentapeptide repeats (8 copies)